MNDADDGRGPVPGLEFNTPGEQTGRSPPLAASPDEVPMSLLSEFGGAMTHFPGGRTESPPACVPHLDAVPVP